ncbi:PREDICTED: uncharacterized protein LOC104604312 [Nelumbo nucifera]|uniref:Uncharacterized protein LOC104604312 n=2 Tax=Nelumbo nucifera TaxID=4432 RepID=A0A1U8AVE9_NELNU|nr:PREDICTED: uncharacterized protein LOC104604312 [Nelumbo nucifera]DAD46698.1 TPA_asm: hypothetical protein HUJ06_016635 [Nelumbo nucifera]
MELKFTEEKAASKREGQLSRGRSQKTVRCNLVEAIAQVHGGGVVSRSGEDGMVRMKIVVKKKELKQMVAMMGGSNNATNGVNHQTPSISSFSSLSSLLSSTTLEQRLKILRRRHFKKADQEKGSRSSWRPVLQSIPEE